MRVVMLGPPGAGKGTQARMLEDAFGVPQISTGDMLRDAERNGSKLGREAQRYMSQGQLVPDQVVIGIVEDRLRSNDCKPGFVLDGFPRTVVQAEALTGVLDRTGTKLDAVLSIHVPHDELVRRLSGRLVCSRCGTMYHAASDPAPTGRCTRCGGKLYQREDDRADRIAARLALMAREIAPVEEYYRSAGLLHEIAGTGSRDEVFSRLRASLP